MNDNKNNANAIGNNNQGLHPPGNGNPNEFGLSPHNYFDSNWASSLLMDPNNDILYNMDFDSQENLTTANPMIYQSNTPAENPNINIKLGLVTSRPTINGPRPQNTNCHRFPIHHHQALHLKRNRHIFKHSRIFLSNRIKAPSNVVLVTTVEEGRRNV